MQTARRQTPFLLCSLPSLRSTLVMALLAGTSGQVVCAEPFAFQPSMPFLPGNLVLSRAVYDNRADNVTIGTILPPNCASTQAGCSGSGGATNDGTYPGVWNNVLYDSAFGITAKIYLDQVTPLGRTLSTLEVPHGVSQNGATKGVVTSFSSKSELALHLSDDKHYLTFMGYAAPVDAIDVSNSNTPAVPDPTNPDGQNFYRAVARVDAFGQFRFTKTNAYSGNNGRAAIRAEVNGKPVYFTVGNAGNGANPQPNGVIIGTGVQWIDAARSEQDPGTPTPAASFSITQLGYKADKIGKDDNYRELTIFNNVLYVTKGSGSNGVNTIYFVDTTGTACPNGVGLPPSSAKLPSAPLAYDASTLQSKGLPTNMCILAGFPSTPTKSAKTLIYPHALWFADANTLYVADQGDGYTGGADLYSHAAAQTSAGLQKWVFDATAKQWTLAYTLQAGLDLGVSYPVRGYPEGANAATGLPWAPATDGLRNFTGRVAPDGTVTLWAVTATISGNGDVGADPNRLVMVRDILKNTNPAVAARESFVTLRRAAFGEVLRGIAFTPGS